ncbi:MAG: 1-acyl-sn-glycerol-3-phosphate acyltransferase [Acidobacteriota bacterium]|nr:1-acyl-sn-glycerol-3-phosphate acyltransferase [Acidobacteriota bacterium]
MKRLRRASALGLALAGCMVRFSILRFRGRPTLEQRAHWLQSACRYALRSLGIAYRVKGRPPVRGLVASNHMSYLDILMLSAVMPCFFVAKTEIERWPFFGMAARLGGTLFLERTSLASAAEAASLMEERMALPVPVLLFPEGTSTDGCKVLRFHPWLFQPACLAGAPVTAVALRYGMPPGAEERTVCWFGDEAFLPHLWRVLGAPDFTAEICFGEPRIYTDRRTAARATHAEVSAMREGVAAITA